MTTKDYSRALCEICGIKPEIIEDYDGNEFEIYPDFTKPENFVKLFEINIPDSTVTVGAAVCFCNRRHLNNRNDFLEFIIQLAKYNKDIKQGIREQEWSYE